MPDEKVINWLLEDDNPAVKYRTQTELLGEAADKTDVKAWIFEKLPENWFDTKGLWYRYYIAALAECGLSHGDIPKHFIEKAFDELQATFDCGCGDFMLMTALTKLGYTDNEILLKTVDELNNHSLPDGGFLCLHRVNKLKYTPKSCYKANLHALLFLAECQKKGIKVNFDRQLIDYFLNRNIFYRSSERGMLVLDSREGWRTIDTFYPFEVMRVGLQNVVEAFSALGYGNDERLKEAWNILHHKKDGSGKYILDGTLAKSYLPKERVGKPSKWITLYALLADKGKLV